MIFFVWAYARVIFASPTKMERRRKEYVKARGRYPLLKERVQYYSFSQYPFFPPLLVLYFDICQDLLL